MAEQSNPGLPDPMPGDLIESLTTLNHIAETLNRAVDVETALSATLARLVELMGLETGWIFLRDDTAPERWAGRGFILAASYNLPPALAQERAEVWQGGCDCQGLCNRDRLTAAYNEVRCSRLAEASGDRRGLVVHASTPLYVSGRVLGIVNVAGPDWAAFSPRALALLTNVGSQMGITLERARLFEMLKERRIVEQAALLELSNQLLSRLDLDDIICYLVEAVRTLLKVDGCALLLPGERSGFLRFRAASGWRIDPVAEQREVPTDERSGSGRAMHLLQPLLIEDIETDDPTPWSAAWLRAEGFRGHAVIPLIVEDRAIGTLVIDSRRPRLLNEDEVRLLRLMANQAAMAIEKARLHQEEVARQRLEKELAVAREIQLSLLPETCPVVPGWECAAIYEAAHLVGGDFYDFFELPGESDWRGLVIADVAGKGVPAALFMALSRTMIRTVALSGRSPAATLQRASELILKDSQTNRFVSAFYAAFNTSSGKLICANAGHNQPYWWQAAAGVLSPLPVRGIVLGVFDVIELEEYEGMLAPGDALIFYTDGITEAMDVNSQLFGEERLEETLAAVLPEANAHEILAAIIKAVTSFIGTTPQSDDFTVVVLRRTPA